MVPSKNLPMILHYLCVGYNRGLNGGDLAPLSDGTTFCNKFVDFVCQAMGYTNFFGKTANEIVAYMDDPTNGWIIISDEKVVQSKANAGMIVIAGWSNAAGHGHVNFILPGILENSSSFGKSVPACVNIGKDVFFGKRISFAFQSDQQPKYYLLAQMDI